MRPKDIALSLAITLCGVRASAAAVTTAEPAQPNIIVIVADDLGWGDVGFNGCREIPTPNLDALARSGVVFTAGYASHPYCSPSRAGLLTGRYQQRFGHESNPGANAMDGLPLGEMLLPALLKTSGYATAAIGKWHLGDDPKFWPTRRGFDYWYGFSGGGMSYWGDATDPVRGVQRNGTPVPKAELTHLTDEFPREAAEFIGRNRHRPFFMYLAYNAPHAPDHATRAHLERTRHIEYGGRAVYGAMVAAMDAGIGQVLRQLEETKLRDRTLIFFFSDNGGRREHAVNFPFRGHKGMLFEGGIRVPFCVSWPTRIHANQTIDAPITALDIFPTVLAAAGILQQDARSLDGVNLLPRMDGSTGELAPRPLFWRYATGKNEHGYAVRDGGYKLVFSLYKGRKLLFDIEADPGEQRDLSAGNPEIVQRLSGLYERWAKGTMPPLWLDLHGANVRKEEAARQAAVEAASKGERRGAAKVD